MKFDVEKREGIGASMCNYAYTEINTVSEFVNMISKLERKSLMPYNCDDYYFRGQSNAKWDLRPAIARGRENRVEITILNNERNLTESVKNQFPQIFSNDLNPVDLLAMLQHHGVPTRLLDITSNALVALYFACQDKVGDPCDGEVFVFRHQTDDMAIYPIGNAIADSYRFAHTTWSAVSTFYERMIQQPYALEQAVDYQHLHETPEAGAEWIFECCNKPLFVQTRCLTQRQKLQQAHFILFADEIKREEGGTLSFNKVILPLAKTHECIKQIFRIPFKSKEKILLDLSLLGISRATLFADSVDVVCEEITRNFSV